MCAASPSSGVVVKGDGAAITAAKSTRVEALWGGCQIFVYEKPGREKSILVNETILETPFSRFVYQNTAYRGENGKQE